MAEPTPPTRIGYSTDQFANFNDYESGSPQADGQDNPPFAYPGNRSPNVYDRAGGLATNKTVTDTRVQRGFIRGIFPEILEKAATVDKSYKTAPSLIPTRRCFFQFNPALILRSVESSTTVLNPLLQPATELLQPIPGQAAFEFQLLFNREREVSNHRVSDGQGREPTMSKVSTFNKELSDYGATKTNPYKPEHVAELGVLADLYVLDSIIGQSITQDSITTLTSYWDIQKRNRVATSSTVENQDGSKTTTTNNADGSVDVTIVKKGETTGTTERTVNPDAFGATDFKSDDIQNKLKSVLGNSAFLSPLPIRIVFSSLFMVEGFVTSSNVAFHKFSNTMIPTVCSVTLNVQALYLGFAKKDSYVSNQLATQLKASADLKKDEEKAKAVAKKGLEDGLKVNLTHIKPRNSDNTDTLNTWWSKGAPNNWTYGGKEIGPRFDSGSRPGLKVYITESLRKLVDSNAVQDIKIDKIELLFITKSNLPKGYEDVRKLQNYIEKNDNVPGVSRGTKQVMKHRIEINGIGDQIQNTAPNGVNGIPLIDYLEPAVIQNTGIGGKNAKYKPFITKWQSSALMATGNEVLNKHFGDKNIMIVMLVKMSCNYASGNMDTHADSERVRAVKSVILNNVNPDTTEFLVANRKEPTQSGLWV